MIDIQPETFTVKVIGEATGNEYAGNFKVWPILHQGQQFTRDEVVRNLLGAKSGEASPAALSRAFVLAEIQVRSIEVPAFWKEVDNGLKLVDENVMGHVYDRIQEVEKAWRAKVKAEADEKRKTLAAMPALNAPKAP